MADIDFSNTFLNGNVLWVKLTNDSFNVYIESDSDVSPTWEHDTFDDMLEGIIPLIKRNIEEQEEINTVAIGLFLKFKDYHQYTMDELIDKITMEVIKPIPFTLIDEDTGEIAITYNFKDDEASNSFHYIFNKIIDAENDVSNLVENLLISDYCKDDILKEDFIPLVEQLQGYGKKLHKIYESLLNVYVNNGLISSIDKK